MTELQLDALQTAVKVVRALTAVLVLVVLGLYALAIYLAWGHRRRILRARAVSLLSIGFVLLVVRRLVGDWIVDSPVKADPSKPAANAAWLIGTSLLRDIAVALIAYGAVVLAGAWLAGPTRWATGARRWLAPRFRDQPAAVFGVVVFVFVLVILWGPTAASRQLLRDRPPRRADLQCRDAPSADAGSVPGGAGDLRPAAGRPHWVLTRHLPAGEDPAATGEPGARPT
jgi:hypothetical protein